MMKKITLALVLCAGGMLAATPVSASPLGTAGRAVVSQDAGSGIVEKVHRRHHRRHYPYYAYGYSYRPYYYRPYRYYYPRYSYYDYGYPNYYRHHRRRGVSIYLNF